MSGIILVGAYPPPYGGVAEFCRRTLNNLGGSVELFICRTLDRGSIPNCRSWRADSLAGLILCVLLAKFLYPGRSFHFNFSHASALLLFLILPGTSNDILTLHNGEIDMSQGFLGKVQRFVLKRFRAIHAINHTQARVYSAAGCERIVQCSTYLKPESLEVTSVGKISDVLASGYFSPEYHFDWLIEYAISRPDVTFSILGYGQNCSLSDIWQGPLPENVSLIGQCTPVEFLHRIQEHSIYARMNSVDSMGIAVCDALHLGVRVIASDVCERPNGTVLFPTGEKQRFFEILTRQIQEIRAGNVPPSYDLEKFDALATLARVYDQRL